MPRLSGIFDIKPQNESVKDILPRNESVIDVKPFMTDKGAGLQGETTRRSVRILAGQYMGLPFLLTYPTAIESWEDL